MARGRKQETALSKKQRGTFRADRHSEIEFSGVDAIPVPPDHWPDYAIELYWRTATELHRAGILAVTDVEQLQSYCFAAYLVHEIEQKIAALDEIDPGDPDFRRLHLSWQQSVTVMRQMASLFGFSPTEKGKLPKTGAQKTPEQQLTDLIELSKKLNK